jgi:hypothetical protein
MGIMDVVKRFAQNRSEKSEKFKIMQEQDRLETMLEERKKSSNRRVLEKFYKDQEEAEIEKTLRRVRKRENEDAWKSNNILKGKTTMLKDNKKLLSGGKSILRQKNIFLDNKAEIPISKEDMFFKW